MKNKRTLWIVILSLAMVALVAAAIYKARSKPKGESVTVEKSEIRTINEKVMASGRIFPETEVKISSDVSGEIVELLVAEGDSVKRGQLLARIDPDTYISSVERGEASLNNARANLATSESQVENAIAQREQIQAQLANARRIHERNIDLLKNGVISAADFELSLSNLEALEANLKASEASLVAARKTADASRYLVRSAEASLKELKVSLNRTSIRSPTDGIVSSLLVEQGERVVGTMQMTGTEMMRIANLQSMEVQVEVSENDILKVKIGNSADIEVDAYLDRKFKGVVSQIANSASNITSSSLSTDQVTNFIVKIRMDPNSYLDLIELNRQTFPFRPGMSATVDIYTEVAENVVTVPIQSVTVRKMMDESKTKDELEEVVFVLKDLTAKRMAVKTGIQDERYVHILSGIEAGEQVITGPYNTVSKVLEDGSNVYIREEGKK